MNGVPKFFYVIRSKYTSTKILPWHISSRLYSIFPSSVRTVNVDKPESGTLSINAPTAGRRSNKGYRRNWHGKKSKEDSDPSDEAAGKMKGGKKPAKPPLTHFLCIPLITESSRPQLEASLRQFKQEILGGQETPPPPGSEPRTGNAEHQTPGTSSLDYRNKTSSTAEVSAEAKAALPQIPDKAIRPLGTLHFTLGVMSLMDQDRIDGAVSLLNGLDIKAMLKEAEGLNETKPDASKADTIAATSEAGRVIGVTTLMSSAQFAEDEPVETAGGTNLFTPNTSIPSSSLAGLQQPPPSSEQSQGPSPSPSQPSIHPLHISLKSLHSMHAPKKTSILYTSPHDTSARLHPFCNNLRTTFQDAGFLLPDDRPLKLHATVVNTIYAKRDGRRGKWSGKRAPVRSQPIDPPSQVSETLGTNDEDIPSTLTVPITPPTTTAPPAEEQEVDTSVGHGPNAKVPLRFDATAVLARYKDFVWASDVRVEKVAICKMGAKKIVGDGGEIVGEEYEEVASVGVP